MSPESRYPPGLAPGWHLEYIDVKDDIMDKTFRFQCDRWLAKNDDDGQIMRELACANNDYLDLNEKTSKSRTYNTVLMLYYIKVSVLLDLVTPAVTLVTANVV